MSLINEALKRTREQSASAGYAVAALPTTPAAPAEYQLAATPPPGPVRRKSGRSQRLGIKVGLGALLVVVLAAFAWTRWPQMSARPAARDPGGAVSVTPNKPVAAAVAPAVAEPKVSEDRIVDKLVARLKEEKAVAPVPAATAVAAATTAAPVTNAPSVAAEPARPVLQGISRYSGIYEAMIDGYEVRVGDEVSGARVLAIDARTVQLQRGAETFQLRLH